MGNQVYVLTVMRGCARSVSNVSIRKEYMILVLHTFRGPAHYSSKILFGKCGLKKKIKKIKLKTKKKIVMKIIMKEF